jgi:hypothetical protein
VTTYLFWWTLPKYNHFAVVFKSCFSYAVIFEYLGSRFVVVQSTLPKPLGFRGD